MKSLEELKGMIDECIERRKPSKEDYDVYEEWTDEHKEEAYEYDCNLYEEYKQYNFLGYSAEKNKAYLFKTYDDAKPCVERGGQILVIDKNKVYNYKVKTDEEFDKYISYKIKSERYNEMNKWGL